MEGRLRAKCWHARSARRREGPPRRGVHQQVHFRACPRASQNMHNVSRCAMDNNRSLTEITSCVDWMRTTWMTGSIFVHCEHETQPYDYSAEGRAHFLAEIDAALVVARLIEFTTFEGAYRSIGGVFRSTGRAHVAKYTDPSGAPVTRCVM